MRSVLGWGCVVGGVVCHVQSVRAVAVVGVSSVEGVGLIAGSFLAAALAGLALCRLVQR